MAFDVNKIEEKIDRVITGSIEISDPKAEQEFIDARLAQLEA